MATYTLQIESDDAELPPGLLVDLLCADDALAELMAVESRHDEPGGATVLRLRVKSPVERLREDLRAVGRGE